MRSFEFMDEAERKNMASKNAMEYLKNMQDQSIRCAFTTDLNEATAGCRNDASTSTSFFRPPRSVELLTHLAHLLHCLLRPTTRIAHTTGAKT